MKVIVQSTTIPVTAALRAFVERQVAKFTHRGQQVQSVMVFLETIAKKKSDLDAATVKMCIAIPGKTMCIKRQANDMYEAIVDTTQRAKRALRKRKERRLKAQRSPETRKAQYELAESAVRQELQLVPSV